MTFIEYKNLAKEYRETDSIKLISKYTNNLSSIEHIKEDNMTILKKLKELGSDWKGNE